MNRWYAAHILMYVKRKNPDRGAIPAWENIVLIEAASDEEALALAQKRGQDEEGDDDGSFRWDGAPAEWVFAGVRKLTLCEEPERRPQTGTEISYIQLELPSEQAVMDLAEGKPTTATVIDLVAEPLREIVNQTS